MHQLLQNLKIRKGKIMRRINKILLLIISMFIIFSTNIYAETEDNTFYINSLSDWDYLAKECELDSFSNNLEVKLNVDLDFSNHLKVIPYFNGTFDGNNHSLTNININSTQINDGVFRITGNKSNIKNINIKLNANHNNNRFGFIAYNQGLVSNLNVDGNIIALNEAGIIVGYNSTKGKIEDCSTSGLINGKEYVGGICGKNYGIINNCYNNATVNIDVRKDDFDISTLTIEDIANGEKTTIVTDYGGICGTNFGTINNCVNKATIGHEHYGYNVGGIAGSQSGYISDCINNGLVYGRKEVGGIVGQLEPSMSLIFQEDYLQKMSREIKDLNNETKKIIDKLIDTKDTNTDYIGRIIDNSNEMTDAIEILLLNEKGSEEYNNAQASLTSSTRDVLSTASNLVDYYKNNEGIYDSLYNISNQFENFGETCVTFTGSLNNEKDMYKDVSNKDNPNDKTGKIFNCFNQNTIDGDINVGRIVGSIAIENDLDPEDDFDIIGAKSFDVSYQIKAIIDKCTNFSPVIVKRNNAGGICGYESLGAIKNCINYGFLDNEECDYIGGIAGKASSYLNNNYSKCFISGSDYVGGIAGSAIKGDSNGSLSQILKFESSGGSIFGNYGNIENEIVEKAVDITNNWYVYDDLAAIDGISYSKKAYKITYEDLLNKKLEENLLKVNVIFMDDNNIIFKKTLNYDETMNENDVPDEIIKDDEYRIWDNYDNKLLKNIKKDILFTCSYTDVYPSISSDEEPLAHVVVNGEFSLNDSINIESIDEKPISNANVYTTYKINLNLTKNSKINSFNVYTNDYKKYNIYVKNNDTWEKIPYIEDGRYASINMNDIECISIVKVVDLNLIIILISIIILALVLLFLLIKKKKIFKLKRKKIHIKTLIKSKNNYLK